jgi:hypothetical protein
MSRSKATGLKPPPRFTGPRVHHRDRGGNTGFIRATPLSEGPQSADGKQRPLAASSWETERSTLILL